jgi:hypothetical protein
MSVEPGRTFRQAWIDGVTTHYPGEPKPGYVAPWEDMPQWEREAATAVYRQIRQFVAVTDGRARDLTSEQKGRFVAICWLGQVRALIDEPKPAYLSDWPDLPQWQRLTDSHVFDVVAAQPD